MCDAIEFELYDHPFKRGWNGALWVVAYCPRCQKELEVRADSAADASEGFATHGVPTHDTTECITYLAAQVTDLRSDLASVEGTLENVRNSF